MLVGIVILWGKNSAAEALGSGIEGRAAKNYCT